METNLRLQKIHKSKLFTPFVVLSPSFVLGLFTILLSFIFFVFSFLSAFLPLLFLRRFASAGTDALQNLLVPLAGFDVCLNQGLQLVPHDAVLLISAADEKEARGRVHK